LDFGGEIGITGTDLCRVRSGFEEGVGDWDGNARGEMHATTTRVESDDEREEINRGGKVTGFR
jgi:hypothetical protein